MSEKRRALGRGLGALIPTSTGSARPVDVFFRERTGEDSARMDRWSRPGNTHPEGEDATGTKEPATTEHEHGDGHETAGEESAAESADAARDENRGTDDAGAGSVEPDGPLGDVEGLAPVPGAVFAELPIASIRPNPKQPRTVFDEDDMAELAASIREIGVLQPVVVRRLVPDPDHEDRQDREHDEHHGPGDGHEASTAGPRFELIMGERRLRASELAGHDTIPAIIKDTQDDALLRDALLENLHRSQLNPLEEAAAYQQLLDDFGCSHEELATRIGRSRPQISNTLRLLRLPPLVARRLAAGVLSAGHARALLSLEDGAAMERLAQRIVAEGLSVRSVEEIVAIGGDDATVEPPGRRPRAGNRHPQLDDLAARLSDRYDTRVTIALGQRKGKLTVEFASVDDLNRIVELMESI